ncbi:DNA binding domain-containing protein, excisionase family [Sulfitobacter brevis]|uniref:DNA binding domain-containing protein, excisionase family n=1 Tax=Sulfitobacter brevis TaxID=74348 RepID=A0A1I2GKL0_9RHOB|nr:helix-turn-helix domain-containing protein [Sulfitobacter brevis]SFF17141.1 DNA binding domain-containing protein, excisionase family [Sulfitobacter brevis]
MTKRYFTLKEATEYSALSRSTLYAEEAKGRLVFTKFGAATRIEKCDLDTFLDVAGEKLVAA